MENIGIANAYVVRYYAIGLLTQREVIKFLQVQVLSTEYLNQASNFSPKVKQRLKDLETQPFFKDVKRG